MLRDCRGKDRKWQRKPTLRLTFFNCSTKAKSWSFTVQLRGLFNADIALCLTFMATQSDVQTRLTAILYFIMSIRKKDKKRVKMSERRGGKKKISLSLFYAFFEMRNGRKIYIMHFRRLIRRFKCEFLMRFRHLKGSIICSVGFISLWIFCYDIKALSWFFLLIKLYI